VDDVARALITERGFGDYFVHRTGHSIDTDLHGSGPNLDNLETRDDRLLVPGVGFSVEPGIYIPDQIGVRAEVNVHWGANGPEVTPTEIQKEIFLLLRD
jgi:Xaa-Pro aminopeptidase